MRCRMLAAAISFAVMTISVPGLAGDPDETDEDNVAVTKILQDVPLIDGHNDLIIHYIDFDTGEFRAADTYDIRQPTPGQSDIPRMRQGMLGAAIFTIWTPDDHAPEAGLEQSIALFHELARRAPGDLAVVTSPDELVAAHKAGKIGIMLGLEGGNPVEGDLARLAWMRERGVAEMGLVWSSNRIGTAGRATDQQAGLTELGKQVVREMNRLGMIIDLSHASPATVRDVTALTTAPVIDTHAVIGTVTVDGVKLGWGDQARTDAAMQAIAATGGLVMPMFMPDAIDAAYTDWMERRNAEFTSIAIRVLGEEAGKNAVHFLPWPAEVVPEMNAWIAANPPPQISLEGIADVYDHVRTLVGIDHIGIGSDFDGMGFHPSGWHPALRDVSRLPALLNVLKRRGWSDDDLRKLAGQNFLRVWRDILSSASSR